MNEIEAFVVNIDYLQNESNHNFSFEYILNKTANNLVFGVFHEHRDKLKSSFIAQFGVKCEISGSEGILSNKPILTNVFIKCKNLNVQLAIFYERGEYLWIGRSDNSYKKIHKWFGDVDRAMNIFKIKNLNQNVRVPHDTSQFLYDYKHSKFIECNKELAELNKAALGYEMDKKKEADFLFGLKYTKKVLEGLKKNYWLAAGTLLGWYRECSMIEHTTDVDMAMWSFDYEKKIKEHFLNNDEVRLAVTIGLVREGYELRLYSKTLKTFDLFLMYKHNETFQWNGYHTQRHIYR